MAKLTTDVFSNNMDFRFLSADYKETVNYSSKLATSSKELRRN